MLSRPRLALCVVAVVSIGISAVAPAQTVPVKTNPFIEHSESAQTPSASGGETAEGPAKNRNEKLGVLIQALAVFAAVSGALLAVIFGGWLALRESRTDRYARLGEWLTRRESRTDRYARFGEWLARRKSRTDKDTRFGSWLARRKSRTDKDTRFGRWLARRKSRTDKNAQPTERRNEWALKTQGLQCHYDKYTISNATQCYIWPKCSSSVDPAHVDPAHVDPAHVDPAHVDQPHKATPATGESLRDKMDEFLKPKNPERYMLLLGDSGAGKTSFLLNYLAYNLFELRNRCVIQLIHLGSQDCDQLIGKVRNPKKTVLFLDALDEDLKATEHGYQKRIDDLMEMCKGFSRVVITSCIQFFPSEQEIPKKTGISRLGRRGTGDDDVYEFVRYYLSPLNRDEIEEYFTRRYPIRKNGQRKQALDFALNRVPKLSARPLLLAQIPDIVGAEQQIDTAADLYAVMVDVWLERESASIKSKKEALRQFSEQLAFDILAKRGSRQGEKIPKREMMELASNWNLETPFQHVSESSLLNCDAEDNYKFAHRSILEYLFVVQLFRKPLPEGVVVSLSDMARQFLSDKLEMDVTQLPWVTACKTYPLNSRNTAKASTMAVDGRDFVIEEGGAIWVSEILKEPGESWVGPTVARAIKDGYYGGSKLAASQRSSWSRAGDIGDVGLSRAHLDVFPAVRGSSWLDDSPLAVVVSAPMDAVYLLPGGFAVCNSLGPNNTLTLTLTGPGAWDIT